MIPRTPKYGYMKYGLSGDRAFSGDLETLTLSPLNLITNLVAWACGAFRGCAPSARRAPSLSGALARLAREHWDYLRFPGLSGFDSEINPVRESPVPCG